MGEAVGISGCRNGVLELMSLVILAEKYYGKVDGIGWFFCLGYMIKVYGIRKFVLG